MDKKKISVVHLGFLITLDRVSSICLINNLRLLGIKSLVPGWVTSHLSDRMFKTRANFDLFQAAECPSEVLQSSALGPLRIFGDVNILPQQVLQELLIIIDDVRLLIEV